MGLQYYDFTLAPNQTRDISAEGTYIAYYSGSAGGADETILVKGDTSAIQLLLKPGQKVKLPENVKTWHLSNYKNTGTITGIVMVGDGEIQDSQVAGTVAVIDGGKARSLAGIAFSGGASQGGVAGQYSRVQLWNPAGSGKNVFVEQIICGVTAADGYSLYPSTVQLATPLGSVPSKKSGGAGSAAQLQRETNAVGAGSGYIAGLNIVAGGNVIYRLSEPYVITPGNGLMGSNSTVANAGQATFEFFEEPI